MTNLFLIRGLPSSGKSTIAKLLAQRPNTYHVEADMYFIDVDGGYNFDSMKIKIAHEWCQIQTKRALIGMDVVVSNTFTTIAEMKPYLDMEKSGSVRVYVIKAEGMYKDVHGVPSDIRARMMARWEEFNSPFDLASILAALPVVENVLVPEGTLFVNPKTLRLNPKG